MIGDEQIQAAIISKLKSLAPYNNVASTEIRELEWQGDTFSYPNIRVELETNEWAFDEQEKCMLQYVEFSIYCFSEQRSSKECSQIKSAVINAFGGIGFTTNSVKFNRLRMVDNVPAVRQDERVWRSQIKFGSRVGNP